MLCSSDKFLHHWKGCPGSIPTAAAKGMVLAAWHHMHRLWQPPVPDFGRSLSSSRGVGVLWVAVFMNQNEMKLPQNPHLQSHHEGECGQPMGVDCMSRCLDLFSQPEWHLFLTQRWDVFLLTSPQECFVNYTANSLASTSNLAVGRWKQNSREL